MKPIQRNEILPLGDYEGVRPHFRARVIAEKEPRRFALGDKMYGAFENRDSVLLQIQEMLRTERITSESGVAHEIATYNELVPGDGEVSACCYVTIADKAERDAWLAKLAGLERCFAIEVDGQSYPMVNSREEDIDPARTTAVQYLKAKLPGEVAARVRARAAKVAVVVTHADYQARAELGKASLAALAEDMSQP